MKNFLIGTSLFASGIFLGVIFSKKFFENKYKEIADEEIESVKKAFKKEEEGESEKDIPNPNNNEQVLIEKSSIDEMKHIINTKRYSSAKDELTVDADGPMVIPPDEFGDNEEYERITLYYFADKVVTDDLEEPLDDIWGTIGLECLNSFGMYEDDCVHVVNHDRKCYYEILQDLRYFSEVQEEKEKRLRGD